MIDDSIIGGWEVEVSGPRGFSELLNLYYIGTSLSEETDPP